MLMGSLYNLCFGESCFFIIIHLKLEIYSTFKGTEFGEAYTALRHNRVDTGFDWYEFGKLVKSHYDG